MAITYKKALRTISVKVHGIADAFQVSDTATEPKASTALGEFEKGHKMSLETENGLVIIPYGAVEAVTVTVQTSDSITKADPYCVDAGESE